MADNIHMQVVREACELLGGTQQLAGRLEVPGTLLRAWLAGTVPPPPHVFLRILRLVRAARAGPGVRNRLP